MTKNKDSNEHKDIDHNNRSDLRNNEMIGSKNQHTCSSKCISNLICSGNANKSINNKPFSSTNKDNKQQQNCHHLKPTNNRSSTKKVAASSRAVICSSGYEFDNNKSSYSTIPSIPIMNHYHVTAINDIQLIESISVDASNKIHRLRLPPYFLPMLDSIVYGCELHCQNKRNGWFTNLYSLTKQDLALYEIPHLYNMVKPINAYIKRAVESLYLRDSGGSNTIRLDKNQPHVLKYCAIDGSGHTGKYAFILNRLCYFIILTFQNLIFYKRSRIAS